MSPTPQGICGDCFYHRRTIDPDRWSRTIEEVTRVKAKCMEQSLSHCCYCGGTSVAYMAMIDPFSVPFPREGGQAA
jgi:hypothetical protein